jgi:hypothetical protein
MWRGSTEQATGQLVVLVMVGLGDQAQPRPQIALHLGPAWSCLLARWLAGSLALAAFTVYLCGCGRSCIAQHASPASLRCRLRAARRKVPAVAQQRADAQTSCGTVERRIIARPAQSARSQQDGGRAGGWAKVPLLDARVGGALGPAGLDSQIDGRAACSERLPSACQRQKRRRRRPPTRAARPRHYSPFPCGPHHHTPPPGAHCRTHHSRGGVRYLSAPFANSRSFFNPGCTGFTLRTALPPAQHSTAQHSTAQHQHSTSTAPAQHQHQHHQRPHTAAASSRHDQHHHDQHQHHHHLQRPPAAVRPRHLALQPTRPPGLYAALASADLGGCTSPARAPSHCGRALPS